MDKKLRWGIVGAADIALKSVMPGIRASATGVIQAVASRGIEKASAAAAQFGASQAYGSYEELLEDPNIDAVYIPLPNHLHREWTIRAAQAGKHVLCEKPLALTAKEAQEMVDTCADAGVVLAEAFMYRHHPRMEQIKRLIAEGEIGQLRALRGAFTFNNAADAKNIRYRADWGGGGLFDVGCYPLSAARYFLGKEPEAVTVHAFFSPEHDNVDMMASGLVEFEDGVALTFDCGMWANFRQTFEIVGTEGRIDIPSAFVANGEDAAFTVTNKNGTRTVKPDIVNTYARQVDDFARAVWKEQASLFQADDAVRNMALLEACLKSARDKARIAL
ncbi:MAG: Gfo/Idh/MocA family oxidoreductase [Cohnella sp.]|nr:Gfo/Idh/MocA family oxidoreductase [Cohnella sp.]